MKKKAKSLPKLKADCQKICNEYIRKRDEGKPCISCGKPIKDGDAGHYFATKGYDGLRFDEDNIFLECRYCNRYDESHLIGYGLNIVTRIGKKRVDELFKRAIEYKQNGYKWSRWEIEEKIEYFKQKIKEL